MELVAPAILTSLLLFSLLFHPTLSTDLTYSPTPLHPYDRNVLLRIQTHFGNKLPFWNPSSDECCVYCVDVPLTCDFDGHIFGLNLDSDPKTLFGDIPTALGDLTFLRDLSITGPYFTGPIPPALGKLTNLRYLYILNTNMTGRIPGSLTRLRNLQRFYLTNNKFTGHIPKYLFQVTSMWDLDLSSNSLSGLIPNNLFGINSSLYYVNLRSNKFSGPIPKSIGTGKLITLDLSKNRLNGLIPDSFKNGMETLRLSNNRLTGPIPKSLGQVGIYTLDLSGNRINDASPLFTRGPNDYTNVEIDLSRNALKFNFSNVKFPDNLKALNISHNVIYGSIPTQLGDLSSLDVSYNQLCGPIPNSPVMKQLSAANFAHNKCLCGAPLRACK